MKTHLWLAGVLAVLGGCVPSLHPLYTEEDLAYESGLVGEWSPKNSKETWAFTGDKRKYNLVLVDNNGKKGKFVVHLMKTEGRMFLDFSPVEPDLKMNAFYQAHFWPVHTFMRVEQIEPTLRMAPLSVDWIKNFLRDHPHAIQHEKLDDRIVLTAKPKELQAFLLKHEKTKNAFGELSNMVRKVKEQKQ